MKWNKMYSDVCIQVFPPLLSTQPSTTTMNPTATSMNTTPMNTTTNNHDNVNHNHNQNQEESMQRSLQAFMDHLSHLKWVLLIVECYVCT